MITQDYLKECLTYDIDKGFFVWNERPEQHFNCLNGYKIWNKRFKGKEAGHIKKTCGYRVICIDNFRYQAHRLAWLYVHGVEPSDNIDHINHIRTDNSIKNLRVASHETNSRNASMYKSNTSGVTGVHWKKNSKKWCARFRVKGVVTNVGLFDDLNDAEKAIKKARVDAGFHMNHGNKKRE